MASSKQNPSHITLDRMFSLKDFTLYACMCTLPSFSPEFTFHGVFPLRIFMLFGNIPTYKNFLCLGGVLLRKMLILHWWSTLKRVITLGVALNWKFSQAWEDISLRSRDIHADAISLGIFLLQRCPHLLHATLQLTASSYFPSENPGRRACLQ